MTSETLERDNLFPDWFNHAMSDQMRAASDKHEQLWGGRLDEADEIADELDRIAPR